MTDTRGPQTQQYAADTDGALPGERQQPPQPSQPYHPPQAYQAAPPAGGGPQAAHGGPHDAAYPQGAAAGRQGRPVVGDEGQLPALHRARHLHGRRGRGAVDGHGRHGRLLDRGRHDLRGHGFERVGNGFDLQSFLSLPRVLIFTSIIAVIDVVLATALATLGAFIYNLSAGFVGGVELTLAEDE